MKKSTVVSDAVDNVALHRSSAVLAGFVALAAVVWAYWPTLAEMVDRWNHVPDYSHGYLVLPIALFFLWSRRSSCPAESACQSTWALLLLLAVGGMRALAGMYYLLPLDGWTLPITIAGCVWLLYGWPCLRWSMPSIVFLWFMVPIPFRVEHWLSFPLQSLATRISTAALLLLGQPAIPEGHTILLGEHVLFVEEACSGLRIFVGIFALAFAFVLFSNWSWWQKGIVLAAVLPVAVLANATRIVVTGLLYQWVSGEAANQFSHDLAGFVMIPFAALLFWLLLVYLDKLFPIVEDISVLPSSPVASSG